MTAELELICGTLSSSPLLSKLQAENIEKVAGVVKMVRAATDSCLLGFEETVFKQLYERVPDFGVTICANLAQRLQNSSRLVRHPESASYG